LMLRAPVFSFFWDLFTIILFPKNLSLSGFED